MLSCKQFIDLGISFITKLVGRSRCASNLIFVTIGTPISHQRDAAKLSEVDHRPEKKPNTINGGGTGRTTMRQARGQTGTWSRGGGEWMGGLAPAIDLPYQLSGGAGEARFPATADTANLAVAWRRRRVAECRSGLCLWCWWQRVDAAGLRPGGAAAVTPRHLRRAAAVRGGSRGSVGR